MRLLNELKYSALAFRQFDMEGGLNCVVAVRGTFVHRHNQAVIEAEEMEAFCFEDIYENDPHTSCLVRQTDLTPGKAGTDVTFLGSAFAPGGKPNSSFMCSLRVGPVEKALRVTGPRYWAPDTRRTWRGLVERDPKPVLTGWTLGEPEPVSEVELGWDKAFGGSIPAAEGMEADVHRHNPLGPGLLDLSLGDIERTPLAHQIEDPARPVQDWRIRDAKPEGFGPISPWWRPRQQYAGTYDEAWLAERHPLLPRDFDQRFWQSAHPDLVAVPYLGGNESYELVNLHPSIPVTSGRLPGIEISVLCQGADEASEGRHRLDLDGVHFDFRGKSQCIILTWRCSFALNEPERAELTLVRSGSDAASVLQRREAVS